MRQNHHYDFSGQISLEQNFKELLGLRWFSDLLVIHKTYFRLILGCEYSNPNAIDCLRDHAIKHHCWGVFKCQDKDCEIEMYSKKSLKWHSYSHKKTDQAPKTRYYCPYCQFSGDERNFSRHMNTHFKFKNYSCTECEKSFFNSKLLETHVKKHEKKDLATPQT